MKPNSTLPEDVAKDSAEMKVQLTLTKLAEIERPLAEAIALIAPSKSIRSSTFAPWESIFQLIVQAKQQHSQIVSLSHQGGLMRVEQESLQKQVIALTKTIAEKDIELAAQKQYAQEETRSNAHRQQQLQTELDRLKQANRALIDELHQLKLQRLAQLAEGEGQLKEQLRQALLERQQLANRLQLKAHEMVRSEKDKEALEQYYDQKWNSEYKKVRVKLEQTYNLRVAQLEEQTQLRTLSIENQLQQVQQEKAFYQKRNEELEDRFNVDQKEKEALEINIKQLNNKIDQLVETNAKIALVFEEEKKSLKIHLQEEKQVLQEKVKRLEATVQAEAHKLVKYRQEQQVKFEEMNEKHEGRLKDETKRHERERKSLQQAHDTQMRKLKQQASQQLHKAQTAKDQAEHNYHTTLEALKKEHSKILAEKQEEYNRNNLRWIDKHCELENLMGIHRRKHEQETAIKNQQIETLIEKEYALYRQVDSLKENILMMQDQVIELKDVISQKEKTIEEKDSSIASLGNVLAHTKHEVDILLSNRKQWKDELIQVGKEFQQSFDQLRKTHEKQISLYRGRISELEELSSKRISNQKQIDRIQKNKQERPQADIHIREAENLILHRVKDYYETRFREDPDMIKTSYKNSHAILARKLKKNRVHVQESISHRVFDTRPSINPSRYSNSAQKDYAQSLSRGKLQNTIQKMRVQTLSSFK